MSSSSSFVSFNTTHDITNDTTMVTALPGRMGNLTPEQTAQLKDMWAHLMAAIGALDDENLKEVTRAVQDMDFEAGKVAAAKHGTPIDDVSALDLAAFAEVRKTMSIEQLRIAFWDMVHGDSPDNLLLRFLRARKWDVGKALGMMAKTFHWRVFDGTVAETELWGEAGALRDGDDEFLLQFRSKKCFIHGNDKEGRPVVHARPVNHNPKLQTQATVEKFTVHICETTRLMLHDPVDSATVVFDMKGFGLSNMDYNAVKFVIQCFEAHYPECLGVLLVHRAPWVFSGIWKIIRPWLDPVIAQKIHFTSNTKDVEKFIDISNIPKDMGGNDPYDYVYVEPKEGEAAKTEDAETRAKLEADRQKLYKEMEQNTVAWIKAATPEEEKEVLANRRAITQKLRSQWWDLDPYQRAPSILDRIGDIKRE